MRIAILSDIYSNVYTLDAVLKDLENKSIDMKVKLEDILYAKRESLKN